MIECEAYDPDHIFKRFKVLEFPVSFVGLSTTQELDVEVDLEKSAYLKTTYSGTLMKFRDAREISPSHRAFDMTPIDSHTMRITFKPMSDCISKAKRQRRQLDNRFVFDLHLIRVDGTLCCNYECHSEIGRFYICGQYEYCNISHVPEKIDFGEVEMKTKSMKYIRIRNDSRLIAAKMSYVLVAGFQVVPSKFTIPPKSSKRIAITVKPTGLKMKTALLFQIRNPYDMNQDGSETIEIEDNFISYTIDVQIIVQCVKSQSPPVMESLHKIFEPDPRYAYLGSELTALDKFKKKGMQTLEYTKSIVAKKSLKQKCLAVRERCYSAETLESKTRKNMIIHFCKKLSEEVTTYELIDIMILPFSIDFGRIGIGTYGEAYVFVKNNTKFDVAIKFISDENILYSSEKLPTLKMKLRPFTETKVVILCLGIVQGKYTKTFQYAIDNKYNRKHPYTLIVGNPTLMVQDKNLKFGMVTNESFVTSSSVRISNVFNVAIDFEWDAINPETPFEVVPNSGSIPKHSCKICDILYVCKASKSKIHELDLISKSNINKVIPIELNVMTRKLAIKFLQPFVFFKDVALNLETKERVKLENSSREIAMFYIVEPLIHGLRIEPMNGIIRPKMIITFEIIVKIACVLEFSFDINLKINNKENVILPVSGNVVEPKVTIHPKNIYMPRLPCAMITYVPITLQNTSSLRAFVEVLDTGDDNIFNVYVAQGNDKIRIFEFTLEGGQSKMVYVKVCDIFRREYEMYIPFKINGILGPPTLSNSLSTEIQYYIHSHEEFYENNYKVKVKSINKDISYLRMTGVITVPWVKFSVDKFEIDYVPNGDNSIEFTMTNISKYYLHVTILITKILPNFTLDLSTEDNQSIINETHLKFELNRGSEAAFCLKFHPKGHGRFVGVAMLYLDKMLTLPYYNMTFIGKRQTPLMYPSTQRIIFPPCPVGSSLCRELTVKMEAEAELDAFTCSSKEEPNLLVKFVDCEVVADGEEWFTIITVRLTIYCDHTYSSCLTLNFNHEGGSFCDMQVNFTFTHCPLTLHTQFYVLPDQTNNPFPYFPQPTQTALYEYLETCSAFLEKWMFQQGFRRDLYPVIPDTFHAISSTLCTAGGMKNKGINVSYLNFYRRIAGPLMKYIRKILVHGVDESFRCVKEIHDTYREILNLLRARGANLWILQAKFLLSYDQFIIYTDFVTPKGNADIILTQELLSDVDLFTRLNKQSWLDFILQSYKVFIMDSCFFDCVCVTTEPRDIIKVIIDWFNEQIMMQHPKMRKDKPVRVIANITTDLSDCIGIISAFLNFCPFLEEHFSLFCEVEEVNREGNIINNACLIIEALNQLRLYFPLISKDLLQPNFLQMLFLSIHLYVTLPMFKPKDVIEFKPPLLRTSTRLLAISPISQESLLYNYIILNNERNSFVVEKAPSGDNVKKTFITLKYTANFVKQEEALLLVHGYNKTRIFDTYIIFKLVGNVGALNPLRKCKVIGPLYRPIKVDVLVSSPFTTQAVFGVYLSDVEPCVPVDFRKESKLKFFVRRLNLFEKEITLTGVPKDTTEIQEHKLFLQMICLSTQIGNTWIWFRADVGEFFIRVTTQPRWDLALDTLQVRVREWPMDPCSCGEACECYRTAALSIPHRNELMVKSLRYALLENASEVMMRIFDELIETTTGKIILAMLLSEGGTNVMEIYHILRSDITYRINSRALLPRLDRVTLAHHTDAILALPVTIPPNDKAEKYSVTFASECGMDIRTYRIIFVETPDVDKS